MKLATYKDGSRDGQLLVVSRDLSQAHHANGIASRMQQVLDDWGFLSPQLEDLSAQLNHGKLRHAFPFDPRLCMAPLPRAFQWLRSAAYEDAPATAVAHGAADQFLGPCEALRVASEAMEIDFNAGLAVVSGDLPQGATPEQALEGVRLLMLANDWRLHAADGWPATAFSPVAVTPDELGEAWRHGRVHLSLLTMWNGRKVGNCEAGPEMRRHFGELMAQCARLRAVRAGSIFGTGPVRNADASRGYSAIADRRAADADESPKTGFMRFGDSVHIEMKGRDGQTVFGAIDQDLVALSSPLD